MAMSYMLPGNAGACRKMSHFRIVKFYTVFFSLGYMEAKVASRISERPGRAHQHNQLR